MSNFGGYGSSDSEKQTIDSLSNVSLDLCQSPTLASSSASQLVGCCAARDIVVGEENQPQLSGGCAICKETSTPGVPRPLVSPCSAAHHELNRSVRDSFEGEARWQCTGGDIQFKLVDNRYEGFENVPENDTLLDYTRLNVRQEHHVNASQKRGSSMTQLDNKTDTGFICDQSICICPKIPRLDQPVAQSKQISSLAEGLQPSYDSVSLCREQNLKHHRTEANGEECYGSSTILPMSIEIQPSGSECVPSALHRFQNHQKGLSDLAKSKRSFSLSDVCKEKSEERALFEDSQALETCRDMETEDECKEINHQSSDISSVQPANEHRWLESMSPPVIQHGKIDHDRERNAKTTDEDLTVAPSSLLRVHCEPRSHSPKLSETPVNETFSSSDDADYKSTVLVERNVDTRQAAPVKGNSAVNRNTCQTYREHPSQTHQSNKLTNTFHPEDFERKADLLTWWKDLFLFLETHKRKLNVQTMEDDTNTHDGYKQDSGDDDENQRSSSLQTERQRDLRTLGESHPAHQRWQLTREGNHQPQTEINPRILGACAASQVSDENTGDRNQCPAQSASKLEPESNLELSSAAAKQHITSDCQFMLKGKCPPEHRQADSNIGSEVSCCCSLQTRCRLMPHSGHGGSAMTCKHHSDDQICSMTVSKQQRKDNVNGEVEPLANAKNCSTYNTNELTYDDINTFTTVVENAITTENKKPSHNTSSQELLCKERALTVNKLKETSERGSDGIYRNSPQTIRTNTGNSQKQCLEPPSNISGLLAMTTGKTVSEHCADSKQGKTSNSLSDSAFVNSCSVHEFSKEFHETVHSDEMTVENTNTFQTLDEANSYDYHKHNKMSYRPSVSSKCGSEISSFCNVTKKTNRLEDEDTSIEDENTLLASPYEEGCVSIDSEDEARLLLEEGYIENGSQEFSVKNLGHYLAKLMPSVCRTDAAIRTPENNTEVVQKSRKQIHNCSNNTVIRSPSSVLEVDSATNSQRENKSKDQNENLTRKTGITTVQFEKDTRQGSGNTQHKQGVPSQPIFSFHNPTVPKVPHLSAHVNPGGNIFSPSQNRRPSAKEQNHTVPQPNIHNQLSTTRTASGNTIYPDPPDRIKTRSGKTRTFVGPFSGFGSSTQTASSNRTESNPNADTTYAQDQPYPAENADEDEPACQSVVALDVQSRESSSGRKSRTRHVQLRHQTELACQDVGLENSPSQSVHEESTHRDSQQQTLHSGTRGRRRNKCGCQERVYGHARRLLRQICYLKSKEEMLFRAALRFQRARLQMQEHHSMLFMRSRACTECHRHPRHSPPCSGSDTHVKGDKSSGQRKVKTGKQPRQLAVRKRSSVVVAFGDRSNHSVISDEDQPCTSRGHRYRKKPTTKGKDKMPMKLVPRVGPKGKQDKEAEEEEAEVEEDGKTDGQGSKTPSSTSSMSVKATKTSSISREEEEEEDKPVGGEEENEDDDDDDVDDDESASSRTLSGDEEGEESEDSKSSPKNSTRGKKEGDDESETTDDDSNDPRVCGFYREL